MTKNPPNPSRRNKRHKKGVNIALQGGGAHGAFTWGVLDKLLEDDRIWIDAISGTSAGAMNAVVAAQGMYENGAEGARTRLREFWKATSDASRLSPIQRSIWARLTGTWSLDTSPSYLFFDMMQRVTSPYDTNLLDINPLRDLVEELVDFNKVRSCGDMGIFISATNVETGRIRVFERDEVTLDSVMASACLPQIFKAVEIDGKPYWDGGFMGNPPLFPFFHGSPSNDIVIVQINPILREGTPKSAQDIQNRVSEITFNSALLHELRAIDFVRRLITNGKLEQDEYRWMHIHMIEARKQMRPLEASSKLNAEWKFLLHLFDIGRDAADRWLKRNYASIGEKSTVNIRKMFDGVGILPHI
ncbi:MAG: patatin-like phospholipase family protein [Pseudomonadota bacterium]